MDLQVMLGVFKTWVVAMVGMGTTLAIHEASLDRRAGSAAAGAGAWKG